jgi:hypothetical protein
MLRKKGYLELSAENIFFKEGKELKVENPHFDKDIAFLIDGYIYNKCVCGATDDEDAEVQGWDYCPYCGDEVATWVSEVHKTRELAEASAHSEALEVSEVLRLLVVEKQEVVDD